MGAALAEFARVMRPGGVAVLLTSQANNIIMRASLATPMENSSEEDAQPSLHRAWQLEHRRSFRLFVKMDACIYVLRRTCAPAPLASQAVLHTAAVLKVLNQATRQGRGCVGKLPGATGLLSWEDGSTWHEQWVKARPALTPWRCKVVGNTK